MARADVDGKVLWTAPVSAAAGSEITALLEEYPAYRHADRSVWLGILAAEKAWKISGWNNDIPCIVNAASSRGATALWEDYHSRFVSGDAVPVKTSPTTTLGNIATHIARHLKTGHAAIEHSVTCGSGLQAIANGMAWLRSGMAKRVLAVATEAPLTRFTLAQMQALGIYSAETDNYPCKAGYTGHDKKNSMVLGEAAVAFCLEMTDELQAGDIYIAAAGFGLEELSSLTSIDPEGKGFRLSMQAACSQLPGNSIPDVIIAHAPGTIKGDRAEQKAIGSVFPQLPAVTGNKWLAGHTFGASGLLSLEWAAMLLSGSGYVPFPYEPYSSHYPHKVSRVMVNAMGFGGNAISVVLAVQRAAL